MYKISKQCIVFAALIICLQGIAQKPKLYPELVTGGFTAPLDIKHCNDSRLFVVGRKGTISVMSKTGTINTTPFLDITTKVNSTGGEQGLLGLAFSPNYKTDGYFFVNYIGGAGAGNTVIARYSVDPSDSNIALPNSELILLQFTQPFTNHNGGNMMFGKDGYLYISEGDGGSQGDPNNYSQNKNVYLGKLLRIDPLNGTKYSIPPSNPYVGQPSVKEEVWSIGLRNPWRCSFDRITGDMWIGDVGQNLHEEIDFQPASSVGGDNYGWRCYEGINTYNTAGCGPITDYILPVYHYPHTTANGCSVTGGYIYRGAQYNNMFGRYFFTDYCSGRIWSTRQTGKTMFVTDTLGSFANYDYSSFGEDNDGEIYLTGSGSGKVWRLTDTSSCKPVAFFSLSDTLVSCGSSLQLQALQGSNLTYQWNFNGTDLNGATSSSLNANATGNYIVTVQKGTCSQTSKTTYVRLNDCTGLNERFSNSTFMIYPIPNSGTLSVITKGILQNEIAPIEFKLFNMTGQLVYSSYLQANINTIDLVGNGIQNGIYYTVIYSGNLILQRDKLVVIQ